ncbi:MAG: hypothetical protein QNJ70_14910 [Xenococcaceae cyanobacterium MO_207.B15]|nr:hypothetical protein [Xenococcaceae cyanobacterium MO_207.B15]
MSTGADYQGSHWSDGTQEDGLGIMNPTLGLQERWSISHNDLLAMDAMGWDVVYPAEINLQALYDAALSQVENAWIEDRINDLGGILNTEAYNWSSRSSTSSSTGWWQTGYWSTYESATTTTENSAEFNWQDSEYSEIFTQISNLIRSFLANSDWSSFWDDNDWGDNDWSSSSSSSWGDNDWGDDDDDDD